MPQIKLYTKYNHMRNNRHFQIAYGVKCSDNSGQEKGNKGAFCSDIKSLLSPSHRTNKHIPSQELAPNPCLYFFRKSMGNCLQSMFRSIHTIHGLLIEAFPIVVQYMCYACVPLGVRLFVVFLGFILAPATYFSTIRVAFHKPIAHKMKRQLYM